MVTDTQKIKNMINSKEFKKLSQEKQKMYKKKLKEIEKMKTWLRNNSMTKVKARWKKKGMM